jgi:hypothetical protein
MVVHLRFHHLLKPQENKDDMKKEAESMIDKLNQYVSMCPNFDRRIIRTTQ